MSASDPNNFIRAEIFQTTGFESVNCLRLLPFLLAQCIFCITPAHALDERSAEQMHWCVRTESLHERRNIG